jgi:hypothetical protein
MSKNPATPSVTHNRQSLLESTKIVFRIVINFNLKRKVHNFISVDSLNSVYLCLVCYVALTCELSIIVDTEPSSMFRVFRYLSPRACAI